MNHICQVQITANDYPGHIPKNLYTSTLFTNPRGVESDQAKGKDFKQHKQEDSAETVV